MNEKAKLSLFRKKLLDFLKKSGREHLPWRKKGNGTYEIWVSEVMLQQTQVARVITYYEKFLKRFPNVKSLARATWEEFLPYYAGLGYYSRGRNMLRAAQTIMKEHGGVFPERMEKLQKLPGIGPYTARAIASFARGEPHLAWDTNLKRVFGRVFKGSKGHLGPEDEKHFDRALGKDAQKLNAAVMDFGSSICVARPKCEACMLQRVCRYYREGGRKESALKNMKRKKPAGLSKQDVRALVFLHEHHQKYYSSKTRRYEPFLLPPGYADRAGIKAYFLKKYGLELSVRPPHAEVSLKGVPLLLVNAQILLGHSSFPTFPKTHVVQYNKDTFLSLH